MIQVQLSQSKKVSAKSSTLVLFVQEKNKKFNVMGASRELSGFVSNLEADGVQFTDLKKGLLFRNNSASEYKNILVVGRGPEKDKESFRRLAATVLQSLKANKLVESAIHLEGLGASGKAAGDVVEAITEGLLLTAYEFKDYKTKAKDAKKDDVFNIHLLADGSLNSAQVKKGFETGEILAETVNFVRRLGDQPGNLMTPEILADETVKAAKGTGLKVTVWNKEKIKKERMGGLYGVSLGSAVDPRFIIMEYNGGAKSKAPVVFVGKGLTFDSGGISIKPSGGMEEMIYDMCGGANVIGTMLAIAKLKLKVNVVGLVPSTENMPGPLANKPGDILTARNGKTVEVYNTDAEGRLILMDALSYASELKPAAIFDAATLTGAMVVALGNSYTGFFTRNTKLVKTIQTAADASGEWVWPMPICDHHLDDMKGLHADLCNISSSKGAGSSTAAAFLEQFVDKDIPWAHFDVAGTAWHIGNRVPYCPRKGASGVMVRTFVELAKNYT
jgi:leucyl aminopeptidase